MKKTNLLYMLLLVTILYVGCNGYDDGPLISLRSKDNRIIGNHKIELYEVNGIDSTDAVDMAYSGSRYEKEGFIWSDPSDDHFIVGGATVGFWYWDENQEYLRMNLPGSPNGGISFPDWLEWKVKRLTYHELWVRTNQGNNTYFIKFVRIKP